VAQLRGAAPVWQGRCLFLASAVGVLVARHARGRGTRHRRGVALRAFADAPHAIGREFVSGALAILVASTSPLIAVAEEPVEIAASYSELLELVDQGSVSRVDFYDQGHTAVTIVEARGKSEELVVELPGSGTTPRLIDKLTQRSITINVHAHEDELEEWQVCVYIAVEFAITFLCTSAMLWILQNVLNFKRRSLSEVEVSPSTSVTFEHVAGLDEARAEVNEIVEFLRLPERFLRVGAAIPRGVMLTGPPGTGKTLLAKALAGEAGVAIIKASAAEFIESYVGVGASRVRDIFAKARSHAPCIVFIDEIDAVGCARPSSGTTGGRAAEREQTLNQLLTEMDGFSTESGIIVVAATNRGDALDKALLRPGRFDRQIDIGLPDVRGREQILRVHATNKKLADCVDTMRVARQTVGFSGAQLENLMNECAILAARRNKAHITNDEVDDALDRVVTGIRGQSIANSSWKQVVAYHEAGHALVGTLLPHHDPVHKVSLIPQGSQRGHTRFSPAEDQTLVSRRALQAQITGALGGRAAERVVFGQKRVTSSAMGDLQRAENLARAMVTQFGMSSVGMLQIDEAGFRPRYSEKLASAIDGAIQQISDESFQTALDLLTEHRACLDCIVTELVEQETMTGVRLREIVAEYAEVPCKPHV